MEYVKNNSNSSSGPPAIDKRVNQDKQQEEHSYQCKPDDATEDC